MAIFALQPIAFGVWLSLIAVVKANIGLDKAQLALALLGMPIGSIPSLQIVGRLIPRLGPRRIMFVLFPFQGLLLILPFSATSHLMLFLTLVLLGVALAFMQVCLNVYAGRLEKALDKIVMSRCHGFWALGMMTGSLLISWLSFMDPAIALVSIALISGVIGSIISIRLPKIGAENEAESPPRRKFAAIPKSLFLIATLVIAVSMSEGAMADWGAVYLSERLSLDSPYIGLGISIFAGCLAAGRLVGDRLNQMMGAMRLARLTISTALVGLMLLILPLPLFFAFVGFAFVGFGTSVGFPLGVSAVAALDDTYESANIAILTTISISGFLIGPPMIGFLAEEVSLQTAFLALVPGLILGIALSKHLQRG